MNLCKGPHGHNYYLLFSNSCKSKTTLKLHTILKWGSTTLSKTKVKISLSKGDPKSHSHSVLPGLSQSLFHPHPDSNSLWTLSVCWLLLLSSLGSKCTLGHHLYISSQDYALQQCCQASIRGCSKDGEIAMLTLWCGPEYGLLSMFDQIQS